MNDDDLPSVDEEDGAGDGPPTADGIGFNAGDARQVKKRVKNVEQLIRETKHWWESALSTDVGRKAIWDVLQMGGFETKFMSGPVGFPDPNATFYQLGKKDYSVEIWEHLLRQSRDGALTMRDERDPRFKQAG